MKALCIGAHPDDCEGSVGGTALHMRDRGDTVRFVTVTDGSKGHHEERYRADPESLALRRHAEALAAGALAGIEYEFMGVPDGEVYVNQANTEAMVRLIRSFAPDLVLLNRPNDYHRDHRYSAQLVLDATYLLTVPAVCPDTPHLRRMPVFAYWQDEFTEGGAFRPDVVIPIDSVLDRKVEMALQHKSQFFEWLPYNGIVPGDYPRDESGLRRFWLDSYRRRAERRRDRFAQRLEGQFGDGAKNVECVEAFQISEYGASPAAEDLSRLFPFPTPDSLNPG